MVYRKVMRWSLCDSAILPSCLLWRWPLWSGFCRRGKRIFSKGAEEECEYSMNSSGTDLSSFYREQPKQESIFRHLKKLVMAKPAPWCRSSHTECAGPWVLWIQWGRRIFVLHRCAFWFFFLAAPVSLPNCCCGGFSFTNPEVVQNNCSACLPLW